MTDTPKATIRKGQHLFNEIAKKHKLLSATHSMMIQNSNGNITDSKSFEYPYYNLHQILFYMDDKEFNEIMESLK